MTSSRGLSSGFILWRVKVRFAVMSRLIQSYTCLHMNAVCSIKDLLDVNTDKKNKQKKTL